MSTIYAWSELRARVVEACGDAPSPPLEQRILAVFAHSPALVDTAITHVLSRYERGLVRSPWPVLATHVEQAVSELDVHATDESERARKVAQAEQWMHAAGLHYDREDEVLDELFGERGKLRAWTDDEPLRLRLVTLWHAVRPAGERVEREAIERGIVQGAHYHANIEREQARRRSLENLASIPVEKPEVEPELPNPFL